MRIQPYQRLLVAVAVAASAGSTLAQNGDGLVAFVTASTGTGAKHGDTGKPYVTTAGGYLDVENGLETGTRIVTGADSTATITLPEFATVLHLEASTEVSMERLKSLEAEVPVSFIVHHGGVVVARRGNEDRWFLVAGGAAAKPGYALLKGASLAVRVDKDGVTFASAKGSGYCFQGTVPGGPLIGATDSPIDKSGVALTDGQSLSTAAWAPPAPDGTADTMVAAMGSATFAYALDSGSEWIKDAEQGDLIPVRGAGRGAPELLRGQLTAGVAFDQPRSIVRAPTSRAVTQPIRTAPTAISVTQSRLESGIPTSVIIGQRLRRTRIIGSPGTSGPIRFNPNAEQLIRLPGN